MKHLEDWSYETVLEAAPESASLTRAFICEHLLAHGLPYLLEDVVLVSSELATNAVEHARTPFVVTLAQMGGVVLLTVQDGSTVAPVSTSPDSTELGGRGLMLVGALSHEWGTNITGSGSKEVWASFEG